TSSKKAANELCQKRMTIAVGRLNQYRFIGYGLHIVQTQARQSASSCCSDIALPSLKMKFLSVKVYFT
ncbi:MAG TPA: hypothetical protein P5526_20575, partial [Anaerolineae bacterium]|nr:hypothetical protein [Anaerolineae bacterium]